MPPNLFTFSSSKSLLFYALVLSLSIPYLAHSDFTENRTKQIFPVTTGSRHFSIDLDYPQAFEVKVAAYNYNESATGFCEPVPSKIVSRLEWSGPINTTSDEPDESGEGENHSYDNIVFFKGYYFILESQSFNITAVEDFTDRSSYITIPSEFQNEDEDQQLEDTYLILDTDEQYLFIITRKTLISYSLTKFFNAVRNNKPIPKINTESPNFRGYEMILSIRYHKHRLYIVADNKVEVFVINNEGQITPQIKFDATFFNMEDVSIADLAFRGNYAFVLDKLKGVYVVDISNADLPDHSNVADKYRFQADDTTEVLKGQFIEIVGDSLHVVSSGTRTPYIFEYIIRGDPEFLSLEFNRKIELFQSVRDTFTDSNFLYLLTGFFNMATKHSIPGRFHSGNVVDHLAEYWPLLGAKALVSQPINSTSRVAVLHEDFVTVLRFEEANPYISCSTTGVAEGVYSYKLNAIQRTCEAKANMIENDFNTVCEINQEIQLLVIQDSADVQIGNVEESKKTVFYLYIGIGIMALLVVVFIYLFRKYKSQYHRLEERIKFHKLENESTDERHTGGRKGQIDSQQEINPYNINIQAELKKDEERERKKSPNKSPIKSPQKAREEQEKPNAEFGDIRPLDVEDIYGRKSNVDQEDSF